MTTADDALLWARTRFANAVRKIGPTHLKMAQDVMAGAHDDIIASEAEAHRAGQSAAAERIASYQSRVGAWLTETFAADVCKDTLERAMRFLEEATELCQALGMTPEQAATVSAYVFGRPVGEPTQEVGGVMVTLASLCHSTGMDMADAGEVELARINTPEMRAKIAAKQVSKRLFGMTAETARAALGGTDAE